MLYSSDCVYTLTTWVESPQTKRIHKKKKKKKKTPHNGYGMAKLIRQRMTEDPILTMKDQPRRTHRLTSSKNGTRVLAMTMGVAIGVANHPWSHGRRRHNSAVKSLRRPGIKTKIISILQSYGKMQKNTSTRDSTRSRAWPRLFP